MYLCNFSAKFSYYSFPKCKQKFSFFSQKRWTKMEVNQVRSGGEVIEAGTF